MEGFDDYRLSPPSTLLHPSSDTPAFVLWQRVASLLAKLFDCPTAYTTSLRYFQISGGGGVAMDNSSKLFGGRRNVTC